PAGGAMPATGKDGPRVGRACQPDGNAADRARNARTARDHVSLRGVHLARELSRREPSVSAPFSPPRAMGHTTRIGKVLCGSLWWSERGGLGYPILSSPRFGAG